MFKRTLWVGIVALFTLTTPSFGDAIENVTINTSAIAGTAGEIAFDFTNNNPGDGNVVTILNFAAPSATLGLPTTQGGLVSGDLILGLNPAPFTDIESSFFFNELNVTFTKFASTVTFTLQVSAIPPPMATPPAEFALFLLNSSGLPLFPTSDPSGVDALFTVDVTGAPAGVLNVFSPTVSGPNNSLDITVPGGVSKVPEPSSVTLLLSGLGTLLAFNRRRVA
jgi:hypothetical protein